MTITVYQVQSLCFKKEKGHLHLKPDDNEIIWQIKRLTNNKASGQDGIIAEH